MKQYIQEQYSVELDSEEKQVSYERLELIVQEAWDQITEEDLERLVNSMKDRCQAVIDAHGGHTRF
jgi:hypothetical protein